jgi:polyferredoxin
MKTGSLSARRIPKKLSPEMRKPRIRYSAEPLWYKRLLWRMKTDSQFQRSIVQAAFLLLCVGIGIKFFFFVRWMDSGGQSLFVERPPGVEGFLPISALISFRFWKSFGIISRIHPAGLFILIAIVLISILLKNAFCSWLCPIGTLSEWLGKLGKKFFGRNFILPKWLDYPLRSIKYLLLGFFLYVIVQMDAFALAQFIDSPYNKMADVKMYLFFADISMFALGVIIVLAVLSVFVKNFWCRYLCPYGALLGLASLLSPFKITRNTINCIDCDLCTKACPANIKVHAAENVWNVECMSCYDCVQVCPVKDTLEMREVITGITLPSRLFALLVIGIFIAITGAAMLSGHWKNNIPNQEYLSRYRDIDSPLYEH